MFYLTIYLQLPSIEETIKQSGNTILTPLVSLDTPGKATVEVVILADPVKPVFLVTCTMILLHC